jgi:hypothetical protein
VIGSDVGDVAYIFERLENDSDTNSTWILTAEFNRAEQQPYVLDGFGRSVSLKENCVAIGAEDGAVFVFENVDNNAWSQANQLTASDAIWGYQLGASVALSSDALYFIREGK